MKNLKKICCLLIGIIPILFTCSQKNKIVTSINITKNGIAFAKVSYYLTANEKDTLKTRWFLKNDTVVQGYPCSADRWLYFNENWELIHFALSKPHEIAGNMLPEKTLVIINEKHRKEFWKDAYYALYYPETLQIQGYSCVGHNYRSYEDVLGDGTYLYKSGKLFYFNPAGNIEIDGIKCKPSPAHGHVYLYESGRIRRCTLAEEQTINGVYYKANEVMTFDENGNVIDPG